MTTKPVLLSGLAATALICGTAATPAHAQQQTYSFDIPAQDLAGALRTFASKTRVQVIFDGAATRGKRSRALKGNFSVEDGLAALLQGSGLVSRRNAEGVIIVSRPAGSGETASEDGDEGAGQSEILVVGSRTQNVDIKRTENDAQPYVVLTSEDIRKSNATNLDDFLRTRLPQNAQRQSINQVEVATLGALGGNAGQIDLRGLGSSQTLILVDGRRLPATGSFNLGQANISGIPLSAIERIEVLPSTAGAIYGGSAVGGVINIVLKRDYTGIEAQIGYGNTFDGATGDFNASLTGGFRLGSTRIMFTASRQRTSDLLLTSRSNMMVQSRLLALTNNPAAFGPPLLLTGGQTGNICGSVATGTGRCDGRLLTLDNGTPLGSSITYIPNGYTGPAADGGRALIANAGRFAYDAPPGPQAMIQGARTDAAGLNIRQPLTDWLELYSDVSWNRIRSSYGSALSVSVLLQPSDANNPFQQPIRVIIPIEKDYGAGKNRVESWRINGGGIVRLPHDWSLSLEYGWNRSESESYRTTPSVTAATRTLLAPYALNDPREVALPDIGSTLSYSTAGTLPIRTTMTSATARLGGPLFKLPAGAVTLTMLAEKRYEKIADFSQFQPGFFFFSPTRNQKTTSLYAETRIPIFSAANAVPAIHSLELQGSIRQDRYKTVGTNDQFLLTSLSDPIPAARYDTNRLRSVDYLLGLRYEPVAGVILRGSYSTGFAPPSLDQLTPTVLTQPAATASVVSDPKRGGEALIGDLSGNLIATTGGNPALRPERSRSFSLGTVLQPKVLSGLRFSADYTDIRKSGEIATLPLQYFINNEASFPGRITRGPKRSTDPASYAGPIVAYDITYINVSYSKIRAWDFQLDYKLDAGNLGSFQPYVIATRQIAFQRSLVAGDPLVSRLDYADGPLHWRGNAGLDWRQGPVSLGFNLQYYDSYKTCRSVDSVAQCNVKLLSQGAPRIPRQAYLDVSFGYAFGDSSGVLAGTEIMAGIQNLLGKEPPVIAQASALTGFYSGYGDPRLRRFTISLRRRIGL